MVLFEQLPAAWKPLVKAEFAAPGVRNLEDFLTAERASHDIFPGPNELFRALELTPPGNVRAVILGQDPYPTPGHAHGLAFSVRAGVKAPRSLVNMYKELQTDLGLPLPATGLLEPWARQGVLLLNTVLTVRSGAAGSHRKRGWEALTDALIRAVAGGDPHVVFLLWGKQAQVKESLIPASRHTVLKAAHPSPLSAGQGFFGSRPYSRTNAALRAAGRTEIDWHL